MTTKKSRGSPVRDQVRLAVASMPDVFTSVDICVESGAYRHAVPKYLRAMEEEGLIIRLPAEKIGQSITWRKTAAMARPTSLIGALRTATSPMDWARICLGVTA